MFCGFHDAANDRIRTSGRLHVGSVLTARTWIKYCGAGETLNEIMNEERPLLSEASSISCVSSRVPGWLLMPSCFVFGWKWRAGKGLQMLENATLRATKM